MRLVSVAALAAVITATVAFTAAPADAQNRRYVRDNSERITFIDQSGRARTKITVRPRSYLDGGTQVVPGERKFSDYAFPPTYMNGSAYAAWDPTGNHRAPLPMPFSLPGFNPYTPF
jgi:hypothetical protein